MGGVTLRRVIHVLLALRECSMVQEGGSLLVLTDEALA